jgi:hypothetical protein
MKSKTAKNIIAIYSLVFGALGLIGSIGNGAEVLTYFLEAAMILLGILLLIPPLGKAAKGLVITLFVIYSIYIIIGFIYFFILPFLGGLVFAMVGVPFAFGIVYLVRINKENNISNFYGPSAPVNKPSNLIISESSTDGVEEEQIHLRLAALNKMLSEGLISQEDYDNKKKSILKI